MSFNSPFNNPEENADIKQAPSTDFDHASVPAYGHVPEVQPTGKNSTLTIVAFILAIVIPLLGLILSIVAWKQTAETGDNRGLAKAGIIVASILLALNIIISFVLYGALMTGAMDGTLVPTP